MMIRLKQGPQRPTRPAARMDVSTPPARTATGIVSITHLEHHESPMRRFLHRPHQYTTTPRSREGLHLCKLRAQISDQ